VLVDAGAEGVAEFGIEAVALVVRIPVREILAL
jgi:hypothetical protein